MKRTLRALKAALLWSFKPHRLVLELLAAGMLGTVYHTFFALDAVTALYWTGCSGLLLFAALFAFSFTNTETQDSVNQRIESYSRHIGVLLVAFWGASSWRLQVGADEYPVAFFIAITGAICALAGLVLLVFGALFDADRVARDLSHESSTHVNSPAGLERLHSTVLLLGVAAGLTVGCLVGIDGMRRLYLETPHPTLYQKITESFATGTVSGTLIAVFVAVGCLVFIFERKLSGLTKNADSLLQRLDGISRNVEQLEDEVTLRTGDLVNILHTNLQIEQLGPDIKQGLVSPESWYLSSWFRRIGSLKDERLAAACAIARSYWCEEAFDISRWHLVTNSRNYAAFLIAVVQRLLKDKQADHTRIYFYTSTPVAPLFLMNMPLEVRPGLNVHGQLRFIDEYMSFIRDAIAHDRLVHKRFIWTAAIKGRDSLEKDLEKLPRNFRDWYHYPFGKGYSMEGREGDKVLGVPIRVSTIADHANLFNVRVLNCMNKGKCCGSIEGENQQGGIIDALREAASEVELRFDHPLCAFPLVLANATDEQLQSVLFTERDALKTELDQLFSRIHRQLMTDESRKALKGDPAVKIWEGLVRHMSAIRGGDYSNLPPAYEIIEFIQALSAVAAVHDVVDGISKFEDVLLRAKWWQYWDGKYSSGTVASLPTFKTFFDEAFHSPRSGPQGPHFVSTERLASDDPTKGGEIWKVLEEIGPEFALVGVAGERDSRRDEPTIRWLVALRSSIAQPWTSGEINVLFKDSDVNVVPNSAFGKYEKAMDYLIEMGRPA